MDEDANSVRRIFGRDVCPCSHAEMLGMAPHAGGRREIARFRTCGMQGSIAPTRHRAHESAWAKLDPGMGVTVEHVLTRWGGIGTSGRAMIPPHASQASQRDGQ
jgi:hypothetical protein